jgi:uncharacterized protein YyaL (SSP411 family)
MTKAALALHAATLDGAWLDRAEVFAAALRAHHWDPAEPGYFLSADDAEALIIRPRSTTDEATPAATSLMTANLIRLWHLTGNDAYRADADAILAAAGPAIATNLFATTGLLTAFDLRLGATDIVLVAPPDDGARPLLAVARAAATPNTILSLHRDRAALPDGHPAAGKIAVRGSATAYVCRGETCSLPITAPEALADLLDR